MPEQEEVKLCPFCQAKPEVIDNGFEGFTHHYIAICENKKCPIYGKGIDLEQWNSRPDTGEAQKKNLQDQLDEAYTLLDESNKELADLKSRGYKHCPRCGLEIWLPRPSQEGGG